MVLPPTSMARSTGWLLMAGVQMTVRTAALEVTGAPTVPVTMTRYWLPVMVVATQIDRAEPVIPL